MQMIIIGLYVHGKKKKDQWKTIVSSEIHKDTDLISKKTQMNIYSFRDSIIGQGEPAAAHECHQNRRLKGWQ